MTIAEGYWQELQREAATARKMLERAPLEKADWKPHEKSMALGRLAGHIAESFYWVNITILKDEMDFANFEYKPFNPVNTDEMLSHFDKSLKSAGEVLSACSDEQMLKNLCWRAGETVFFTRPRTEMMREMNMNHFIHHRAQLGVYLRLLDIPVPATYGPSADEQ